MNVLLKKILVYLSIFVFFATFFISRHVGLPILHCFLRGSIAMVVVGGLGRFVLKNIFKDIALELAAYERKKEDDKRRAHNEKIEQYENYDAPSEKNASESKTKEAAGKKIVNNPFANGGQDDDDSDIDQNII